MKKIVAAFDGLKYSTATQDYAIKLAVENKAFLVGVFLDDLNYHTYKIYDIISEREGGVDTNLQNKLNKKDAATRARSVKLFESACNKAGIDYTVHKDHRAAIRELLNESIYADLLVISEKETFTHLKEQSPTNFIHELLPHVQCPVFVVPASSWKIDELVLLYDGEPSSVHAIKTLGYVLPALESTYTEVVTVRKSDKSYGIPDAALIREFISRHFPNARFLKLKGDPETTIIEFLQKKRPNTLVVLGAYRRSAVSRWFRPSMADALLNKLDLPLFIAHNK